MKKKKEKAKSPYARHGKTPYQYSPELMAWTAAIKRGDAHDATRQDTAWRHKFAPWTMERTA